MSAAAAAATIIRRSSGAGQEAPGIRARARAGGNPHPANNPEDWLGGGPILGFQLPSIREPRYLPPDPAWEEGVGRAPGMRHASYEEDLHTFDRFYMGVGVQHPEPHEAFSSLHQMQVFDAQRERDFIGEHEEQNPDIKTYGEAITVPARQTTTATLSRRRR